MESTKSDWWMENGLHEFTESGHGKNGINDYDRAMISRAEASFNHAAYRLSNHHGDYDRIDAVLALKRAVDARLEHLNSIYDFSQYPESKNFGRLGLLENWGVILQRTLRRLRRLRNAVEHDGAEPPTLDECEDYREVCWWFLKGTIDYLSPLDSYDFSWNESSGSFSIDYSPLAVTLFGDFTPELLSDSQIDGWIKLNTLENPAPRQPDSIQMLPIERAGRGRYLVRAEVADQDSRLEFLKFSMDYFGMTTRRFD
ncbi:hypothetical protein [Streptomyces buecherae]|uniref:hypothetical protein n=1 Tax=Streptomyces buecherae TaxID=2763006 RepID=UPI003649F536